MSDYKGEIQGKKLKKQMKISALNLQFADEGKISKLQSKTIFIAQN